MSNQEQDIDEDDFARDAIDPQRSDGKSGPPDGWERPSWRDYARGEWWYRWREDAPHRPDPPPVLMLGHGAGLYWFVTKARELRSFSAGQLHGRGGLADLFAGDVRWAVRHFPSFDREGNPTKRPNTPTLMEALISRCVAKGYYDGTQPFRSIGTWRGPDDAPVVHAGGRIFFDGHVYQPGELIGEARYVLGPDRTAPAHVLKERGRFEWLPADQAACHTVMAHLDEWHWAEPEARELFAGGLWCDMLGDALRWKTHKFVRASKGSGKSTLLRYISALLGGAAHPIQRTYSKARLEEQGAHTALAILLEEAEGDPGHDADRMKAIFQLLLLLSDEGAVGGRFKRDIDLHGPVTMVATLTDDWRGTIKTRIVLLELRALKDHVGHDLMPLEAIEAMVSRAHEISAGLRARVLSLKADGTFDKNLVLARDRVIDLGGDSRDGDTLGHMIAGWATMVLGRVLDEDEIGALARFEPWITTLQDSEDGGDDATELLNVLLGLPAQNWRGGDQLTIGQLVARARLTENADMRRALLPYGLRLEKMPNETWEQAWLAVANKHPGLDRLFADYPQYRGGKRAQILSELKVGGELAAKPSVRPLRFAGPQSRALLIDPRLLPSRKDDDDAAGPAPEVEIPR